MAVAEINNIIIEKGTDFEATFKIFNDDNSLATLSGTSVVSKIRKYPTSPNSVSFGGPPLVPGGPPSGSPSININSGTVTIYLSKEQTTTLSSGRNYFDILLTKASNTFKVLKGTIIVEDSSSL